MNAFNASVDALPVSTGIGTINYFVTNTHGFGLVTNHFLVIAPSAVHSTIITDKLTLLVSSGRQETELNLGL